MRKALIQMILMSKYAEFRVYFNNLELILGHFNHEKINQNLITSEFDQYKHSFKISDYRRAINIVNSLVKLESYIIFTENSKLLIHLN